MTDSEAGGVLTPVWLWDWSGEVNVNLVALRELNDFLLITRIDLKDDVYEITITFVYVY